MCASTQVLLNFYLHSYISCFLKIYASFYFWKDFLICFVDDLLIRGRFGSNREWQAHCTTQAGGELKEVSVQPPAHSRLSCEIRLSPGRALSCWVLKTSKDGDYTTSLGDRSCCPHGERGFLYIQFEALLFQLLPVRSHLSAMHHWEEPISIILLTPS